MLAGVALFTVLSAGYFWGQVQITRPLRDYFHHLCQDNNGLLAGLRALPNVPPSTTLYFTSMPDSFTEDNMQSAVQVALRRTDVRARLVKAYPPEAKYRLRFEHSRIVMESP